MCVCVGVVGGQFSIVQSATQTPPRSQTSPTTPSYVAPTSPQMFPPVVSITTNPKLKEHPAPRIHWVSGWRESAAEEDRTDPEDTHEDGDEETDGTDGWMEIWGLTHEYTLLDEEMVGEQRNGRATVEKRNEEEGESDEEIESDLGSLRELGSEDEQEPCHRLQIFYGLNHQRGEEEWSETEDESLPSTTTSKLHGRLIFKEILHQFAS